MDDQPGDGPYDQVEVTVGTDVKRLSRADFEALPLDQRIRSILQKRIKFYCRGKEISVGQALKNH